MQPFVRFRASTIAFGSSLAAIYAAAFVIVARLGQLENPDIVAGALTLDLTLLVPLLYYLLLGRPRGWPAVTILPVFLASVLVAGQLIPSARHHVLDLVSYAAVAAELALVAFVAHKALQVRRRYRERSAAGGDVHDSLRESARSVLGPVAGGVLAYEVAVFYYAVFGWFRSRPSDDDSFTVYRSTAYPALIAAVMIALVVETVAVHLLLSSWSPVTAWVFSGLGAYAMVWLIGDLHAVRLRPVQLAGDTLDVRIGLRWSVPVPLASIRAVGAPSGDPPVGGAAHLKALLIGAPNRRIELTEPVCAVGLYGLSRRVTSIDLQIDEPSRFDAALAAAKR